MSNLQTGSQHPHGTALLVGTEEVLLYTRSAILRKHGFAISIASPEQAVVILGHTSFDLTVACHTLTSIQADALVVAARKNSRPPALLAYSKQNKPAPTLFPFDASIWSLATPETLISTVDGLLASRRQ